MLSVKFELVSTMFFYSLIQNVFVTKKNLYGDWQCLLDHIDHGHQDNRLEWAEIMTQREGSTQELLGGHRDLNIGETAVSKLVKDERMVQKQNWSKWAQKKAKRQKPWQDWSHFKVLLHVIFKNKEICFCKAEYVVCTKEMTVK